MSITLILIAAMYAVFDIQPVFILITFIFVGAVGAVTVAIAATYRQQPKRSVDKMWVIPALITSALLGYSIYTYVNYGMEFSDSGEMLVTFTSDYMLLAAFLISLSVLLMMAVVKFVRREGT
jgi:NADH-quinone oxidoreductase subunit J